MNFQLSFPIRLMHTARCPTTCDNTAQNVKNYKLAKLTRVLLSNIFIGLVTSVMLTVCMGS